MSRHNRYCGDMDTDCYTHLSCDKSATGRIQEYYLTLVTIHGMEPINKKHNVQGTTVVELKCSTFTFTGPNAFCLNVLSVLVALFEFFGFIEALLIWLCSLAKEKQTNKRTNNGCFALDLLGL